MTDSERYVDVLINTLQKKNSILKKIQEENEKQEQVLKNQGNISEFDECITRKDALIRRIEGLDSGFQSIFNKIGNEMQDHKEKYADAIRQMQDLIREMTELSVHIETTEKRNQHLVKEYMIGNRRKYHETKKSIKVASDYYKTMRNGYYMESMSLDAKK